MKNIIILSTYFHGRKATANGLCAAALAKEFLAERNDVDIVCYKSDGDNKFGISTHEIRIFEDRKQKTEKKSVFSKIRGFFIVLKYFFIRPNYNKKQANAYYSECEKICMQNKIDIVIAMYFPFESAFAVKRLKKSIPRLKQFFMNWTKFAQMLVQIFLTDWCVVRINAQ